MTRLVPAWLLVAICCSGCLGRPINGSCAWPGEPAVALDLRTGSDRRHLNADARIAEELAIHYADVTRGKRSGHFIDFDEYHRTRERCLAALSVKIAQRHGIQPAQVAGAVGRRDERLDALVILIAASLFIFTANGFTRRLFIRFPPDEPWPALVGTAAGAILLSAGGVALGGLGAAAVEMIQLGDTHLSYRAYRLPWNQHWLPFFIGGLILFSLIAMARWRRVSGPRQRDDQAAAPDDDPTVR